MQFCDEPCRVDTVLGSCVAVTMWDRRQRRGCICHAVMPHGGRLSNDPFRYVDSAISRMIEVLEAHQSRRPDIEVKLFGGASIHLLSAGRTSVGAQNIESALAALAASGMEPLICEVGGTQGRKLQFYTGTGEVYVKRIGAGAE
jgi:chemotaxis protein CheD